MKNICKNPGSKEILPPVIILLFTIITRFHKLTGSMRMPFTDRTFGSNGVDEGIFLMTGKLVSEGYRMYSDVNTQQGPLFSFVFSAIGGDPFGARFITATIAVIGVATLFTYRRGWEIPEPP